MKIREDWLYNQSSILNFKWVFYDNKKNHDF